jgi:competence protein ComEC
VKQLVRVFSVLAALAIALTPVIAARTLDIYFIDVEGGHPTPIVTPSGQSLLVDTGFAIDGRDPRRIVAALHLAGVTRIDYLLLTHRESAIDRFPSAVWQVPIRGSRRFERRAAVLADLPQQP